MHITMKKGKKMAHKTELYWRNERFNQYLADELFTIRRLEKGL